MFSKLQWVFQDVLGKCLFASPNANFALCNEKNRDLFLTITKNITGGPSISFNRHMEIGKTNNS